MKRIKILHLIPTLDKGGAERLLIDLVKTMDKERFEVEVVCLETLGKWGFELKKAKINASSLGKRRKGSIYIFWKLYRLLKNKRPDILHTHLFGADLYGLLAGRIAQVPNIISTEHNLNYGESWVRRAIKKKLLPKMDKGIAVSEAVKNYLKKEGIPVDNIEVIHNGIDLSRFKSREEKGGSNGFIIGSIGRLSEQKGYKTLVEAMEILKEEEISCLIVGEGEERQNLEKKVNKDKIANKILFLGKHDIVPEFLVKLDAFVLPSIWEGFGLVLLEAGASKLPVIASRVDGINEIIRENINGLQFRPGDSVELAEKIKVLAHNKEMRESLANELYKDCKEKFTIQKMSKQYEDIYFKLTQ